MELFDINQITIYNLKVNKALDYYTILEITPDADTALIKKNFRKLAQQYHPDKNNNSPESKLKFLSISNAYQILIDPQKRKSYDIYLYYHKQSLNPMQSSKVKNQASLAAEAKIDHEEIINQFNYILWEIDDLLHDERLLQDKGRYPKPSLKDGLQNILQFLDKWVLSPAGFPDYFYQARQMEIDEKLNYYQLNPGKGVHTPYVNLDDYFYQIRRRMDRFIKACSSKDLTLPIKNHNITLLEIILEAQMLSYHYLAALNQVIHKKSAEIQDFQHSHPYFIEKKFLV